jgi:hypothetical protein
MGVSSDTLIHLTSQKEHLHGILREGFKIKYCHEFVNTVKGTISAGFPMISLSDLPLSQLYSQILNYGNYGIGMKKEWAKRQGLNPVLYIDENSSLGGCIREDFKDIFDQVQNSTLDYKLYETTTTLISYMKNYQGRLETPKILRENYRFSDEREWRYVPSPKELNGAPMLIDSTKKAEENPKIEHLRLLFHPDDINYIFVETEDEISEIIKIIRDANSDKSFTSVERLMTRIITTSQIRTDF